MLRRIASCGLRPPPLRDRTGPKGRNGVTLRANVVRYIPEDMLAGGPVLNCGFTGLERYYETRRYISGYIKASRIAFAGFNPSLLTLVSAVLLVC